MTTPKETVTTVTLDYYKTNVGIFLRNIWGGSYNGYSGTPYLNYYKFNGKQFPNVLRGGNFFLLEGLQDIEKCEKLKPSTTRHSGYLLIESVPEALVSSLKPFYSLDEVGQYYDDNSDRKCFSNKEFAAICGMYKEAFETVSEYWYEVEIKHNILGEIVVENWQEPEKMVVRSHQEGSFNNKIDSVDLSAIVCYQDFERMLTPEFMLHTRPCSLTSDQVYKIVRAHVKDNINPMNAYITSDYDFCFTVKRKVKHKPITTRTEIKKNNGRSYATPKFKSNTETHKLVEIFEMTPASKKYSGYTVIQGWEADNLVDMQEQIKYYLDTLMHEINADVQECPHCNGVGAIVNKIATNER